MSSKTKDRRAYTSTTKAAIGVTVALTLVFAGYAVQQLVTLEPGRRRLTSEEVQAGLTQETAKSANVLVSGLILVVCLLIVGIVIGIARRHNGARYAAIALFLLLGVVVFGSSLTGALADPPARNAGYGLLCGLLNFVIVALLLTRSTAIEFDQAEVDRRMRMARQPATTGAVRRRDRSR